MQPASLVVCCQKDSSLLRYHWTKIQNVCFSNPVLLNESQVAEYHANANKKSVPRVEYRCAPASGACELLPQEAGGLRFT